MKPDSILYKLISRPGVTVIAVAEFFITKAATNQRFFDVKDFVWVSEVEANTNAIAAELEVVLNNYESVPELKKLSAEQERIVSGNRWKSFFFYAYGERVEKNCMQCPVTDRTARKIPGMLTAFYSILEPQTRLTEHRGPYKGVLRYHLALKIPKEKDKCGLRIEQEVRHWENGKSLVFDDSYLHEAWNDSEEMRVVLFVDFVRPLPFPLSLANRMVIWLMSQSPFIQNVLKGA
jgi:beta-hydroxylase